MDTIRIKNDENAFAKLHNIQALKASKGAVGNEMFHKRAALGELGNRGLNTNTASLLSKIKEATNQESLKNAKAKVDTHWRNNDGRKIIRTESLKSIKTVNPADSNVAVNKVTLRSATNKNNPVAIKQIKEQKPAILKARQVTANKKEPEPIVSNPITKKVEGNVLKREESNLSRRSLTKLKAVLSKGATKRDAIVATKVENGVAIRKKVIKIPKETKPSSEVKVEIIEKVKVKEDFLHKPSVAIKSEIKSPKIEDVDANDFDNIFACPEYVNDIYKYFNHLENVFAIEEDFMKNQREVTPRMRAVLLDWINEVAHQFRLIPETYQITVGLIDRYLQLDPNTTRGHLQLVGVTALFIATKYEELYSSDIADFVYMTENSYTKEEVIEMEKKIMRTLDFQMSRPFPLQFLRRFSKVINVDQIEHVLAKYILELVSIEYHLAHYKPSEIAAATLYLSVQLLNIKQKPKNELWNKTAEYYSGYSATYLEPIVQKIAKVVKNAPNAKHKTIYRKFKQEKYAKIAARPELYGVKIDRIINSPSQLKK